MASIRVLDKHTAELIAAGEVVERPASVVKELMENAIDAGASQVKVEIEAGGVSLIRISDNGCGIPREEVATAFLRHATSKIAAAPDLEAIGTLGFRGEALASIAAVSKVEMMTRTAKELSGTRYTLCGGEPGECEEIGCPQGTTIVVRDLFYNVPARLKFLKKDISEGNAVAGVVDRLALSHPEVAIEFRRDGKDVLATPGDGTIDSAVYAVLGRELAGGLLDVDYTYGGVRVFGKISRPANSRANRAMQFFFLNGRVVRTKTGGAALEQGYKGRIMTGRFPACMLYLDMPASCVDVNVHPAKTEVRFIQEKPVFDAVFLGVRTALETGDRPKTALFEKLPEEEASVPPAVPEAVQTSAKPLSGLLGETAPLPPRAAAKGKPPAALDDAQTFVGGELSGRPEPPRSSLPAKPDFSFLERSEAAGISLMRDATAGTVFLEGRPAGIAKTAVPFPRKGETWKFSGGIDVAYDDFQENLPAKAGTKKAAPLEPDAAPIRVVGEVFETYIVAQKGDCLYLIDKHAAHERLLYEELKNRGHSDAQMLLQPQPVLLSKEEADALLERVDLLSKAGFEIEEFGGSTLLLRSVPMSLGRCDYAALLQEIAAGFLEGKQEVALEELDVIFHSVACRAAIKAGDRSRPEELDRLANEVLLRDDLRYCPHGRPVCIQMSRKEMEKQFGRSV